MNVFFFRVQSDLARYARQCFGSSIFETLQRSASTVQSYLQMKRNLNETLYKIPGIFIYLYK